MKEKLMQLIKENRVAVGPWYNQPDEWTSGELLVRNLLRGKSTGYRIWWTSKHRLLPGYIW